MQGIKNLKVGFIFNDALLTVTKKPEEQPDLRKVSKYETPFGNSV